jgi:y4mF family transcriptional regulator
LLPYALLPDQEIILLFSPAFHKIYRRGNIMIAIDSPADLGVVIRKTRKALGLTQPQLALAAGVGVRFIVELEAGKPTVRLEHILRVVRALGGRLAVDGIPPKPAEEGEA